MTQHDNPEINRLICENLSNTRLREVYKDLLHIIECNSDHLDDMRSEIEAASICNELISARTALVASGVVDVKHYRER